MSVFLLEWVASQSQTPCPQTLLLPRQAHPPVHRFFPSPKNVVSVPETLLNVDKPSLQTLYGDDDPDVKEAAENGLKFC